MLKSFFIFSIKNELLTLVLVSLSGLINFNTAKAQSVAFINYTDKDGLASNTVYAIQQDSRGLLWLSTESGVSYYNGKRFTNLTTDNGLPDNEIFRIFEDSWKRIWFITYNGKLAFYKNGKVYSEKDHPSFKNFISSEMGIEISEDSLGSIWYLTSSGVIEYTNNNTLDSVSFNEKESRRFITRFALNNETYIFSGSGILRWSDKKFLYEDEILKLKLVKNSKAIAVRDQLFFSSYNRLLRMKFDDSRCIIDTFNLFNGGIQALQKSTDDNIWVSTSNGAHLLNIHTNEILMSILPGKSVSWVLTDRENILWASTLGSGIYYSANPCVTKLDISDGLAQTSVYCMSVLPGGKIIAGHETMKSTLLQKGEKKLLEPGMGNARRGRIYSIRPDSDHSFWTISEKIIHYDLNKKTPVAQWINYSGKDMVPGFDPGHYFITGSTGLSYINFGEVVNGSIPPSKIKSYKEVRQLTCLHMDEFNKTLYVGGHTGLYSLRQNDKLLSPVNINQFPFKYPVTKIIQYDSSTIAFSTFGYGVFLYNGKQLNKIGKAEGLNTGICYSLHKDSLGNIWVATAQGINKIEFGSVNSQYKIKFFSTKDGIISSTIFDILTIGDSIYCASADGISVFRESDIKKNDTPPLLFINDFNISGTKLDPGKINIVRSDQNHVRFSFESISFRSQNLIYRYKLDGIDGNWNETKLSEIEYAYLSPGEYKFYLTAINEDGVSVDPPVKIQFRISRPFYKLWWFYFLLVALIIAVFYFTIYAWFRRLAERHDAQQKTLQLQRDHAETERKLIELEHMALRLHMNPHFVFNAINTIQGFYAANDILRAKSYISKFSRLIRSIMDTSREQHVPLEEEIKLLRNYLELCALRMEYPFSYEISWSEKTDPAVCQIAPMLVQPFVENAILHGISPLKGGGHIIIRFTQEGSYLECTIEDNGIGRERSARLNIGKLHKSSGIKVTQERISLINKSALMDTQIEILDLYDDDQNPSGTRVRFRTSVISDD